MRGWSSALAETTAGCRKERKETGEIIKLLFLCDKPLDLMQYILFIDLGLLNPR